MWQRISWIKTIHGLYGLSIRSVLSIIFFLFKLKLHLSSFNFSDVFIGLDKEVCA